MSANSNTPADYSCLSPSHGYTAYSKV